MIWYIALQLVALSSLFCNLTWSTILLCVATYSIQMFGVTAGYHRYFSHRSYKTSRAFHSILALTGALAVQRGPLWWASTHRHHHKHSDTDLDPHSPKKGFWYSHVGWFLSKEARMTNFDNVKDLLKYKELRLIEKYSYLPPIILGALYFMIGGLSYLLFGFFFATVLSQHSTFTINSLAHIIGKQRFNTGDASRNNLLLALITFGEGWHNNHHFYQSSAKQGLYWYEIDMTYYILFVLSKLNIVWSLRENGSSNGRVRPNRV